MAELRIVTGSSFSVNRNNIDTMLIELGQDGLDKESSFRFNRAALDAQLKLILVLELENYEPLPSGSSFRQCRPSIRRMFNAAYTV